MTEQPSRRLGSRAKAAPSAPKIAVGYCVHDDGYYLADSIESFQAAGPVFVFVSRVPWHGESGDWETAAEVARTAGASVVEGDWTPEDPHRCAALDWLRDKGFTHALIPDGDEIVEPRLLQSLLKVAQTELAERVYVWMDTYWKSPEYVIRPRENLTPALLLDLRQARHVHIREFEGGRKLILTPDHGVLHHLSYVGPDERIQRKVTTWGHRLEVQAGWWENVWTTWDADHLLRNLHPTHPPAYGFAERIAVPEILQPTMDKMESLRNTGSEEFRNEFLSGSPSFQPSSKSLQAGGTREVARNTGSEEFRNMSFSCIPKFLASSESLKGVGSRDMVSVVIPLHGGSDDIRACLTSLQACGGLIHETIVVDNASPDDAAEVAETFPDVRLVRNETNRGFAAACNQGFAEATGEIVLFLNSDTVVPRAGLLRLVEALTQSGTIAAAGPYTNNVGHGQRIEPTYTSLETLDLFAEDFAQRPEEDVDTDMLVGFCLAVRRRVMEELGGFDEQFGLGTFEDNDLCYRMRRAGYRLVIVARSFVHHHGSKTLRRLDMNMHALLQRNEALFRAKWRDDLESGYASQLSGLAGGRIVFDPARHPDLRAKWVRDLARRADISLCMIVRDEERVLADCLASAKPFFREMIVVDTGSIDRTVKIAESFGAKVVPFPWTDSFSEARNESLRHAKGRWIFWMDADDTLPWSSGEALLNAALHATPDIAGFIVPVQFVEDGAVTPPRIGGPGGPAVTQHPTPDTRHPAVAGTRVDHVKLFRNRPGIAFKYHIHEQILPSLSALHGGRIIRSDALVLHSGYDTSPEGQAKKRARDLKLLRLDLIEHPRDPFVLFNIGMTYHFMGQHARVPRWMRRSLRYAQPGESHLRKVYALLAGSLRALDRNDECLQTITEGLQAVPGDPELHFLAGILLTALGQTAEAKAHYLRVIEADLSGCYSSVDVGILGFRTFHNLGDLCRVEGRYAEAKAWWLKAIEAAPHYLLSAVELFRMAMEVGDNATAQQMLESIRRAEGESEHWAHLSVQYAEAQGGEANGELFLRQVTSGERAALGPRLVWARRLLHTGRVEEALPHLQVLNHWGVAEGAFYLGVFCTQRGDLPSALTWMQRAAVLDPHHIPTREQVSNLERALTE